MSKDIFKAIDVANVEWMKWGGHAWDVRKKFQELPSSDTDDDLERARYVLATYCPATKATPSVAQISSDKYAWSAVFMSYLFLQGGYTKDDFPFSAGHSKWIRRAVRARRGKVIFEFHAHRIDEELATPKVGDLIAYARPDNKKDKLSFEKAQSWFDRESSYNSHSDLVVAARDGEIEVIGGNVKDSVLKKIIPLDASGRISDRVHPWFAVLRRRQ